MYFLVKKSNGFIQNYNTDLVWVESDEFTVLQSPENIAPGNCKVLDTDGVLSLIAMNNETKAVQNTNPFWTNLRAERKTRMIECDWTQLPDTLSKGRLTSQQVSDWADYRQALANVPQNCTDGDPAQPNFPEVPV